MTAQNKRTGNFAEFTLEQWRNMEKTGHARYWKIIDAGVIPKEDVIDFSVKKEEIEPVDLTVDYDMDYKKLLDEAGVEYNHSIKKPEKLKAIWDEYKQKNE